MTRRKFFAGILLLVFFTGVFSCKSTKRRDETSKLGKAYQNMTSYYNGYFNANEIYIAGMEKLRQMHEDDYNNILSLYPERDVTNTKSVSQDFDKVVEKLGRVIVLHRASNWVDDSYLLMGKAQYAKQDFEKAQQVFEFFVDEMNPAFKKTKSKKKKKEEAKKKKKKKKEKKEKKKKKRKTARQLREEAEKEQQKAEKEKKKKEKKESQKEKKETVVAKTTFHSKGSDKDWYTFNEGLLWMAKTYIENEKWASAYYLITRLKTEKKNDLLRSEYPVLKSYYYLKQKNLSEAVAPLKEAVLYADNKKKKARYAFILGQVYEKLGNRGEAYKMFEKAQNLSSDYDLEFNARLKLLKNYSGNSQEFALNSIKDLLKEEKYDEYKDRIYYTMAQIYFSQSNEAEGIANLHKSNAHNSNNNSLKAESYYKLGSIYFDKEDYIKAKNYYDSTLMVLDKKDERYSDVKNHAGGLSEIARNLKIIQLQDSLIKISYFSEDQKRELALNLKKQELKRKEAQNKKQKNDNRAIKSSVMRGDFMPGGINRVPKGKNKSSMIFYNPAALEVGKKEFTKTWGVIELADDWRRSNRSDSGSGGDDNESTEDMSISDSEIKAILKDVPNTPEKIEAANKKIIDAMLRLGILYRENLSNNDKSVEVLEKLLNRYHDFDDRCKAMYYLNLAYLDLGRNSNSGELVGRMSKKFPDCIYTKILTDPNFGKEKENKINAKEEYYTNIFNMYQNGDYEGAITKIESADKEFLEDAKYKVKIAYLQAKLAGKTKGKDGYILALEDFVKLYPKSKEAIHARESLRFLKGDKDTFSKLIYEEDLEDFSFQPDKMHYVLVVIKDTDDKELNKIKASISQYNKKYYKLDKLKMSNIYFDTKSKNQVILLRKFTNSAKAMKYYSEALNSNGKFIKSDYDFEMFIITQKNYREVIKQRSIDKYRVFFDKKYLKESE